MKYHIVYKTVNTVNGKIYVGAHSTDNLNDGYIGSGKLLNKAIKKYGIDAFHKEVISIHETKDAMFLAERAIVNDEFIKRPDTYNLKLGGSGGGISNVPRSQETKNKISSAQKGKPKHPGFSEKCSKSFKGRVRRKSSIDKAKAKIMGSGNGMFNVPSSRRGPHWEKFDELKIFWESIGCPKYGAFRSKAVQAGFPDVNYCKMVDVFTGKMKYCNDK